MKKDVSVRSTIVAVAIVVVLGVVLVGSLMGGQAGAAAETDDPCCNRSRLISVNGEAEVRVVPDEVVLTVGVETNDLELDRAKAQADEVVRRVIAAAGEHGIEQRHIQTDYLHIEPRYYDSYENRRFLGYFVSSTVVLTLEDVPAYEDVLTAVLGAGVTHVHGIQFRTTELRRYRDQARALAIRAASEKAEALASELGQSVGRPTAINEGQASWWSWYGAHWGSRYSPMTQNVVQSAGGAGDTLDSDSTLAPGEIAVRASVSVTFELE